MKVRRDEHRCDGIDVGAPGVAERVAPERGSRPGNEQTCELAGDFAPVPVPDAYPSIARWVRTWARAIGWLRMCARSSYRHSSAESPAARASWAAVCSFAHAWRMAHLFVVRGCLGRFDVGFPLWG